MRKVSFDRPFIEGMVTDQPAYKLGPRQSVYAQDLIAPNGIATQRKGWAYDGTTADVADNLVAVHRNKYLLADATRTLTCDDDGDIFVHNASAAGTAVVAGSVPYLPRCVYRDELIWCAQDGLTPLIRYSGSPGFSNVTPSGSTSNYTDGQATLTGATYSTAPPPGSYINASGADADIALGDLRVLTATTTSVTLEGVMATTSNTISIRVNKPWGYAYPAVNVYDTGTANISGPNLQGYGTAWIGVVTANDGFLFINGTSGAEHGNVRVSASNNTQLSANIIGSSTKSPYAITRKLPFKDAQAHKGSLFGTGVAQHPNNVYVGPPLWNLSFPPGFVLPFDAFESPIYSQNANDFLMDFWAIPSAYEGDVNVAILSSPNPLLVLKRSAVYGMYGAYPNFSVDKIADGVGCIDLRSAISGPTGQFWAGEDGIYAYVGGQVIDLTNGKINREWRSLTDDFDYGTNDYCAIGESNDHLLISIVTAGGTIDRTYVYDLRNQAWISRFSNHKARYFFSSKVDGEQSELYWVGDNDQGRVMKSSMVFDGTGLAKDGDGTSPRMQAWTGSTADGTESVDNDARLLDLAISHNVYDAGAAGSTQMAVSVVSGGSLESNADSTKTLTDIDSDATDRIDRTRYRHVNAKGRHHQIRVDVDTLGTNTAATKIEIPEIAATVRDRRSRT